MRRLVPHTFFGRDERSIAGDNRGGKGCKGLESHRALNSGRGRELNSGSHDCSISQNRFRKLMTGGTDAFINCVWFPKVLALTPQPFVVSPYSTSASPSKLGVGTCDIVVSST